MTGCSKLLEPAALHVELEGGLLLVGSAAVGADVQSLLPVRVQVGNEGVLAPGAVVADWALEGAFVRVAAEVPRQVALLGEGKATD